MVKLRPRRVGKDKKRRIKTKTVRVSCLTMNLQRKKLSNIRAALVYLNSLKKDFIALQEIPKDFRDNPKIAEIVFSDYQCFLSDVKSNQSKASACSSMILIRKKIKVLNRRLPLTTKSGRSSGAKKAMRHPACRYVEINGVTCLVGSSHSTSGGGGGDNTNALIDSVVEDDDSPPVVIIGGDFNTQKDIGEVRRAKVPGGGIAKTHAGPKGMTALDGFVVAGEAEIKKEKVETESNFTLQYVNGKPEQTGCMYGGKKVSDHRPIVGSFTFEVEDEDDVL